MVIEVCVDSLAGAQAALDGGADRLEVCSALELGGLTPSPGLVGLIQDQVPLPLMVMIRPRGGDFCYDAGELATMERDAMAFRERGVAGLVFGCLDTQGMLDEPAVRRLLDASRPAAVTFHRAIDVMSDALQGVDTLADLGVERVLSSGQAASAAEGLPVLQQMMQIAQGRLVVMPGGGIREHNVRHICCGMGIHEIHCGASTWVPAAPGSQALRWHRLAKESVPAGRRWTSSDTIRAIRAALGG